MIKLAFRCGLILEIELAGLGSLGAKLVAFWGTKPAVAFPLAHLTSTPLSTPVKMKSLFLAIVVCVSISSSAFAQMAAPLPIGREETWFLDEYAGQLRAERKHWISGKTVTHDISLPARDSMGHRHHYVMAANEAGLWIVESSLLLLRPNGNTSRLDLFPAPEPRGMTADEEGGQSTLVALNEESLLLLSKRRGEKAGKAYRVRWQGQSIKVQELTNAPYFNVGIAATKLRDGRVLIVGGYISHGLAWLYNPQDDSWEAAGKTMGHRMYPAIAALPDGRAFIAGSDGLGTASDDNQARLAIAYGAEIWNPRTLSWSSLPDLPLSFRISAHGVTGPSAAVTPDGSLVLGGAMHKYLLYLRTSGGSFAPYWQVTEPMDHQRVGGIVQALGNDDVLVVGGRGETINVHCCEGQRTTLPRASDERQDSVGRDRSDALIAHRGDISFVAGGWENFYLSFAATQASAVAELIDHRRNRTIGLPPLPHATLTGRALWVDDDRIMVKAIANAPYYEQPFRRMDGRSLEAESVGYFAIYDLRKKAWRTLVDDRIKKAELAGFAGREAILIGDDAQVWAVSIDNFDIRRVASTILARRDGTSRVLDDGQVIAAGGESQNGVIQAIDADCVGPDCPVRDFGYGPFGPTQRYETYRPATGQWQLSAKTRGAGSSAVVRRNGRVVSLGLVEADRSGGETDQALYWLTEQSDRDGKRWRTIALPEDIAGSSCGRSQPERSCTLLLGEHPTSNSDFVFLVHRDLDRDRVVGTWMLDDAAKKWVPVSLASDSSWLLRKEGEKRLHASFFARNNVRLWLE